MKHSVTLEFPGRIFRKKHPEGIVLTPALRQEIATAIREKDVPILIEGETGTGKEQIVQLIHRQLSAGHEAPLVILNCANLKKELAAATLFGHKKGSFTGAIEHAQGAVGRAHGGMLVLDEFHRLESSVQEQILRTMQDGSYQRIGDSTDHYSRFRLVIATPKSLEHYVMTGQILPDLRFRLYGIEIKIPPLRERLDQMGDFIDCYLAQSGRDIFLSESQRQDLIDRCSEFYWQGNIRQLFGVLQMLFIKAAAAQKAFDVSDLPIYPTMLPPAGPGSDDEHAADSLLNLVCHYTRHPTGYEDFIDRFERQLITQLASQYPSVNSMCQALHIGRSTLYAKKRRLGLSLKDSKTQ